MQYYKLLENIQSKYWSPVWSESNKGKYSKKALCSGLVDNMQNLN